MKTVRIIIIILLAIMANRGYSQQLVFSFINPAFGGNPNNASWLLQSAQAQSDYQQKNNNSPNNAANLEDFAANLNSQILYSLANAIVQKQFGANNSLKNGEYNVGQFRITIGSGATGLTVTVFDNSTGNQTQIIIPNP